MNHRPGDSRGAGEANPLRPLRSEAKAFELSVPPVVRASRLVNMVAFFGYLAALPFFLYVQWLRPDVLETLGAGIFWPFYLAILCLSGVATHHYRKIAAPRRLEVRADGLSGPTSALSARTLDARWDELMYVRRRGRAPARDLVQIGVAGQPPFLFTAPQLGGVERLTELETLVRAQLAELPDAAARECAAAFHVALIDRMLRRVPWCTLGFAGLMLAGFGYQFASGAGTQSLRLAMLGGISSALLQTGEAYRLFSMALLHVGGVHLAVNLYVLLIFGYLTENVLGRARFAIVLLASIAGGSLGVALLDTAAAGGASGGIAGLITSFFYLTWKFPALSRGRRTLTIAVSLTLGLELAADLTLPNIAWPGHLGGAVVGLATTALLLRRIDYPRTSLASNRVEQCLAALLAGVFCLSIARAVVLDLAADPARIDELTELVAANERAEPTAPGASAR